MPTDEEYKDALRAVEPFFKTIKIVLDDRLKNNCIHTKDLEEVKALQANFRLLSQLETEIQNTKVGN